MKILFILPCTAPFFPSSLVRAERFFPQFKSFNIECEVLYYHSPFVKKIYQNISTSFLGKYRYLRGCFLLFTFVLEAPYRFYKILQIILMAKKFNAIMIQAVLLPIWANKVLKYCNKRIIFDFDDALYVRNNKLTRHSIKTAWKVFAGSRALLEFASQYNPNSVLIPSCVPIFKYSDISHNVNRRVKIGWIGGESTIKQLNILVDPLKKLIDQEIEFELLVAGSRKQLRRIPFDKRIKIIEIPVYYDEDILQIVKQIDIGVMPLYDTVAERGKCAYKALIYMASQIPSVCSPVGEIKYIIQDGVNGYLASTTEQWFNILARLIADDELRNKIGKAGKKTVEESYTTEKCFRLIYKEMVEPLFSRNRGGIVTK